MAGKLVSRSSITINAPVNKIWQALTDPAQIKEYLFGTNTVSDWKKGSPITYEGELEGKKYQDKGTIIDIIPEKLYILLTGVLWVARKISPKIITM